MLKLNPSVPPSPPLYTPEIVVIYKWSGVQYLLYVSNSCLVSPQNYLASIVVGVAVGVVVQNDNAILILSLPQFFSI